MRRIFRHRPSPAMIVALIALFVAMGGVSYGIAANTVGTIAIKNSSIRNRDIRRGTITSSRLKEAYGFVNSNGTVRSSRSKNITASRIGLGTYCVKPKAGSHINPRKSFPVVSADFFDGPGTFAAAELSSVAFSRCPASSGWTIITYDTNLSPLDGHSFGASGFQNVAFSIVVPTGAG
jgi:hypothetical protein